MTAPTRAIALDRSTPKRTTKRHAIATMPSKGRGGAVVVASVLVLNPVTHAALLTAHRCGVPLVVTMDGSTLTFTRRGEA